MQKGGFHIAFAIGQIGPDIQVIGENVKDKNVVKVLDSAAPADGKYGKLEVFFEGEAVGF